MSTDAHAVLHAARQLAEQDQPYALVSVLRVQPPASARPGDKAIVSRQGFVAGWIGGGCAQPAVLRTVAQALDDGRARVLRIAPGDSSGEPRALADTLGEVLEFGMACHSGGTLELFVDPVLPRARLTIIGDSPVAQALHGLAPRVGFDVTVAAQGAEAQRFPDATTLRGSDCPHATPQAVSPGSYVVVATQGKRDVQGLRCALALGGRGVWLVASARKAGVLKDALVAAGSDAQAVAAIVAPAGQAIGAATPEEVALSVLAAVVAARRQGKTASTAASSATAEPAAAVPAQATAITAITASNCCGGAAAAPAAVAEAALPAAMPATATTSVQAPASSCCGD